MQGDKTYIKNFFAKTLAAVMQAAQPYIPQAEQVQAQGLAEDLAHAQVTNLDQIIQTVEAFVAR